MILSTASPLLRGGAPLALALFAVLAYAAAMLPPRSAGRLPGLALVAGWLVHLVVLVFDIGGAGQPGAGARLGFAPVLSLTVWLVIAVHAVEGRFVPLPAVRRWLAPLGALAVVLALVFPGETRPIESAWAPLHYALGIGSYGLFGAAVLHALMLDAAERRLRLRGGRAGHALGMPLLQLERLTFRFVEAGFTLFAGMLFGEQLYGRAWRWEHKTVFSLLSWLAFAVLLLGRARFGWRGRSAVRVLYAGAALLLLAYVGSRFVLEVVLHRSV
jgi:ABC-type uncharacterized transport system permease subunit